MMEEILCDARRQIRSIVKLCEEFGDRNTRAKRANLANSKIGDNCAIFVRCKATNPQPTLRSECRGQTRLHYAEPRGGKACAAGLT